MSSSYPEKEQSSCLNVDKLPFSIKILLEAAIRNCDGFQVLKEDVEKIIDWQKTSPKQVEIPFKPARVILQVRSDFASDGIFSFTQHPQGLEPFFRIYILMQ